MKLFILLLVTSLSMSSHSAQNKSQSQQGLVLQTSQTMIEIHRIFSEAWRLLVGNGVDSTNSAMKVLSSKLLVQKNGEILNFSSEKGISQEIKLIKKLPSSNYESQIASWKWNQNLTEFVFTASPNQLTEGVGEALSMLNQTIKCKASLNLDKRMTKLSCENLGNGLSRTTHVMFSKFEYDINSNYLIVVEADKYENLFNKVGCDSKEACLKMVVPSLGAIKIVENRKKGESKKTLETKVAVGQNTPVLENKNETTEKGIEKNGQENTSVENGNGKIENSGEEATELQLAGYRPEDFQQQGPSEERTNPVFLSEGQHPGMHR